MKKNKENKKLFEDVTIDSRAALPAVVLALVALIKSGGVKNALGICFKIGGIAWTLIPIIIVDLFIAATAVCFALCTVFLVPVLFVYLEKRKACKDYDLAEQYLNHVENADADNIVDLRPEEVAVANA